MLLTIFDFLSYHTAVAPFKTAFILTGTGGQPDRHISYSTLGKEVSTLASSLAAEQLNGERVMLVYHDALAFIISFLACQQVGAIAVPAPPVYGNKQFARLQHIIVDAAPSAILCKEQTGRFLQQVGQKIIFTDTSDQSSINTLPTPHDISFIQYTSGSTNKPKGVVVTHTNLIHNQQLLKAAFNCTTASVIFSWLPFHHDMGLIGNILHTIFTGCTCVLMPAADFIQQPLRWLEGVSRYRATHSGGPNFAYDLCIEKIPAEKLNDIDLTRWKVAFNGSEPIRPATLRRFADHFAPAGFKEDSFYPCYGLAEATLLVTARRDTTSPVITHNNRHFISSGSIAAGIDMKIIAADTKAVCNDLEEGEICIAGESITSGYWQRDCTGLFHELDGTRFLRTGDTGFLHRGELFILGRSKEMLIVRGKNIFPNDIEQAIAGVNPAIDSNGVAVFAMDSIGEKIAVVIEIKRPAIKTLNTEAIIYAIEKLVAGRFGVTLHDIVLTSPFNIPRTTSGKLQRTRCPEWYSINRFNIIDSKEQLQKKAGIQPANGMLLPRNVRNYLLHLITSKTGSPIDAQIADDVELAELGIDSLQLVELVNAVNREFDLNIHPAMVMEHNTISMLAALLENMLWLKNEQNSDNEVII
ncbi:Long-chain-fatty-acid--(acyl-carrier-protein) ligase [Niastella koreensis GR20-10]|uniref:Long-chain-fatty-acid--(Acyl-carrier-protein) ligase n=2 Tax=Niastella koreensis TaxID=354356 RepID=G8TKK3_NIAKG|nr:AMP-binding protein [Niastella koreensis]AEV98677.1 Long-chain-fatty-acid--(acyl-carrier-protein) ligase [Niastella koreensis GR20-10]